MVVSSLFAEIVAVIWTVHLLVTWHDSVYIRKTAIASEGFVKPLDTNSGRSVLNLGDDEENSSREKKLPPIRISLFNRFRSRSPPVEEVGVERGVGVERRGSGTVSNSEAIPGILRSPTGQQPRETQQYKAYRPSNRDTIG